MKLSDEQMTAALKAADAVLPEGDRLIYLLIASDGADRAILTSATNIVSPSTRVRLLRLELEAQEENLH